MTIGNDGWQDHGAITIVENGKGTMVLSQRRCRACRKDVKKRMPVYQLPVFSMDAHGSAFGSEPSFCSNSIDMPSGERTKAI